MTRVWVTMRCLRMSLNLPSQDDEGADNNEVSPCVIGLVISG